MKIIEQSCGWLQAPPPDALQILESAGRVCYKSEDKITADSAAGFIQRIMKGQHESVIEHVSATVRFITDRGVTHEMVRHRIASYSQESTRYCNYCKGKFGNEMTVILPVWFRGIVPDINNPPVASSLIAEDPRVNQYTCWWSALKTAETNYQQMVGFGATAQEARSVLPNSLKTEIVMTANLREWRHFFKLRTAQMAHPQMRDLALQALAMFKATVPILFDDLPVEAKP